MNRLFFSDKSFPIRQKRYRTNNARIHILTIFRFNATNVTNDFASVITLYHYSIISKRKYKPVFRIHLLRFVTSHEDIFLIAKEHENII